ncbi:MAG TPA: efflux RND transporter permease subunit, partial [Planctomycetota bacterium]|nr:efflux RND transporter permease subunit [Planctomycetota bacterium]
VFERSARAGIADAGEATAVAMAAAEKFDAAMRELSLRRLREGVALRPLDWQLEDRAGDLLAAALGEAAKARGHDLRFDPPASKPFLKPKTKAEVVAELDSILQVPGWGNIWTQPIVNRVDMLSTGVRTMVGVKVFGSDLGEIQRVSNDVAAVLRKIPGAVDVVPDQITGENYLEIRPDRERAARYGVDVAEVEDVVETAIGGKALTTTVEGRRRFPVRVRYARDFRDGEDAIRRILVTGRTARGMLDLPLAQVADVRTVAGPSMIKSENGLLRSYVQLNVRDRDIVGFVEEARRVVRDEVESKLPPGMYIEWSGQFEHQVRARRTLSVVFPAVVALIFLILYLTYRDAADAALMMLAVPGALVGGLAFQVLFGFNFSVAVWVGYIVCFGLAAETGIVMLVYLREAVDRRGGLRAIASIAELEAAVVEGAVHRLRPKLLTEGCAILGLVPMLLSSGTGAEIMRPMAAPVLGGILIADEVIDVLIPVLFYWVRRARWEKLRCD